MYIYWELTFKNFLLIQVHNLKSLETTAVEVRHGNRHVF